MTQEEKQLLLKDLCARLPFNVIVECSINSRESIDLFLTTSHIDELINDSLIIKPYLRPMTNMTENERWDYNYKKENHTEWEAYDYLNSIHIDYRGLIKKGLAIEAPENMYEINKN